MAKTASHTDTDILNACARIAGRGQNVTNQAVINELGGGTFTRIAPLVKQFKGEAAPVNAPSEPTEAPLNIVSNEIAEPVLKAIASVIAKAEADAKKAIDVEAHKSALALSAIDVQLKTALAEAETMSATIADLEAKLEASASKVKALEKKLSKATKKPAEEQKKLPL